MCPWRSVTALRRSASPFPDRAVRVVLKELTSNFAPLRSREYCGPVVLATQVRTLHQTQSWSDKGVPLSDMELSLPLSSQVRPRPASQSSFMLRCGCGVIRLGRVVGPSDMKSQE